MEDLNLTETEMRYFGDLFLCCDEESNGKIPILKATELFRSSNVPNDILKQIMDISVAPNNTASLNHLNRKQFYSALKLIAAHQTSMAIKPEVLTSSIELPLPRFTWTLNSEASSDLIQLSSSPKEQHIPKRERNFVANLGSYEPMRLSSNLSDSDVPQNLSQDATEGISTDSEMESETLSQRSNSRGRRAKNGSPWSTASESPTPTNSVAERVHPVWEHSATGRGVWPGNTGEEHTQLLGTEEESSDRHSSEEEGETDAGAGGEALWAVSDAQARHYAAQFAQLRPERGLLAAHVARLFFEKSRLSVSDLRKIWQLAVSSQNGSVTLREFSTAMHLIVLRRGGAAVPPALPAPLAAAPAPEPPEPGNDMFSSGTSADFNLAPEPEAPPPPPAEPQPSSSLDWTIFVDSPTSRTSPYPKPVNFDFQKSAVERDPKIFHPVARRVTPESERESPRRRGPAREPPPPPPRPLRQHARSSSLDLTRLPPPPPPRPPSPARGAFEPYRGRSPAADARALRDHNAVLQRVCRALQHELADVQRERQALRARLADPAL